MAGTPGPIRRAWYQWKMQRFPWRKKWLVGFDLQGNTFWEFKDALHALRNRRIAKYSRSTHLGDVQISPSWMQWLRHTRFEPPTVDEQHQDLIRQARIKQLAAQADARWAEKPSALDAPDKQQPMQMLQSKDPDSGVTQMNPPVPTGYSQQYSRPHDFNQHTYSQPNLIATNSQSQQEFTPPPGRLSQFSSLNKPRTTSLHLPLLVSYTQSYISRISRHISSTHLPPNSKPKTQDKHISHQQNMSSSAPILTFETASRQLPAELLLLVLTHYIGTPEFVVDASKAPLYTISYKNASSPILSSLPSELVPDYHKVRVLGYKRDVKTFTSGYDFYMTHLLLSLHAKSLVPAFPIPAYCLWTTTTGAEDMRICLGEGITLPTASALVPMPRPPPHALSTIRLDLTAREYFNLFAVFLPPSPNDDRFLPSAAEIFLAHTSHLILHFGDAFKAANPWYETEDPVWCETLEEYDYGEARCRPHVCDSGAIVDWILESAWDHEFLQHIPHITLEGDVQGWVRRKWQVVFERNRVYWEDQADWGDEADPFAIHNPDIPAIMARGVGVYEKKEEKKGEEEEVQVDPRHLFPPPCKCEIGCWRLGGGKVLDEPFSEVSSWDQFEEARDETQEDWMDGVELGLDM
ncbi:NDUFA12 domain-containing protein [Pyrenophora tritici-repentis]|nr:NDUFA12 domain-containing protein [Pyrenophora tritici-repentis]KAI0611669.1 NDUFA12 domain-containing protein [Pyrenophora tritici-repentis]KAI0623665.1 NDUFA12 domain-containing protein [Pyrenophora tritici-repentis]